MCCTAFAAILFNFFWKRRSSEINGGEANNDAAAHDETARGSSSSHTSPEGQGMAASSGYDYEVFLSFRGPDTRSAFTNFLYISLKDVGIRTFKDDEELRVGEEFAPELLQAINQSKISIPIFSKDYASSIWCLKEVAQMVENKKTGRQKIMPIFYDVAPSEVRYQTGGYGDAFHSHKKKKRHNENTMQGWKDALSAVGEINGWDLHSEKNRREGEFAKNLTKEVFRELKKAYLVVSDCLVDVDNHVDAIMEMFGAETSETQIMGIHGMGGIGKTTIAKIIYNQLSENFEGCCFLSNIREVSKLKGIQCLQHQLISDILNMKWTEIRNIDEGIKAIKDRLSNKRVLLLLDDVEENDHMNALVGNHDWFGKGSKLIITTRKKDVLIVPEVDCIYEVNGMDDHQSLQLFSKHAFRRDSPLNEYIDQSKRAIGIAGGLPLALEVIGSLLSRTEKKRWDYILEKLENVPPLKVQSKLKISFDSLEFRQQHIFLDIACFFIGYDKDIVVHFWEKSNFFPEEAMEVLENLSLIKIDEYNLVWMHDQLRDLGREMVRQESKMKIEKQSRAWNPQEALNLLRRHKGKKVEALRLNFDRQYRFTYEDFMRLSNLRFLEVGGSMENFCAEERLLWHELPSNILPTNDFQENSDLLPQLRWLSWHELPPTFKITNFSMEDVVILDLSSSEIGNDWKGGSHMKVMKNLKVLDLSHCLCLKRTPNLSAHSNLERLILFDCGYLMEIDRSICQLKCLVSLDLSYCENLRRLPDDLGGDLASLEYLSLRECKSLERLPDTIGNLESLINLNISGTGIKELPDSIGNLVSLIKLDISRTGIKDLPDSIGNLELLIKLNIYGTGIKELPDSIGKLKNLKVMNMWGSEISKIPDALWTIEKLEEIEASNFSTKPIVTKIGNCIYKNKFLRILKLKRADIYALPRLPESITTLHLNTLYMDIFPDLSNLTKLKDLNLWFGSRDSDGKSYQPTKNLRMDSHYVTTSPIDLGFAPQLKSLHLRGSNLCYLPRLPSSLSSLRLEYCESLCLMEDLSNLKKLSSLQIDGAVITEIQGLGCLENLRDLLLYNLAQVKRLPDLSKLNKLMSLRVGSCGNLVEIQGELPESLDRLKISFCYSLQKLPNLSSLMGKQLIDIDCCDKVNGKGIYRIVIKNPRDLHLREFEHLQILPDLSNSNELISIKIERCGNLVEIQGELPQSLEELKISWCESLQKLPDLSGLKRLEKVDIKDCKKLNAEAIFGFAQRSRVNLWQNLWYLWIGGLGQVEILSDLSNLNKLKCLRIENFGDLVEIQGELPQSLKEMKISSCESLQKLPDLSSLKGLRRVKINRCGKLNVEAISWLCSEKLIKFVGEDDESESDYEYDSEDDE
ncbi:hypothetical protein BT93_B1289 [Corymbia citriodora subsp. variegata]|nr:hypothetical protein BT93_B1289 [Corymbia citriodora subsp. variegata]